MKPLICVKSLHFSYWDNAVLDDISFDIREGDFVALIGPNGSGKTTLIRLLLGLLPSPPGVIELSVPRRRIGYVPQKYTTDKNFPGTVSEILSTASAASIRQAGIADLMTRRFVELSGGQQQRVLIALALEQSPKLLILDEPTAGVDIAAQQSFYTLLKKLNKQGIAVILVTHEVGVISSLVKKVLCISHDLCCAGAPHEMPKLLKKMYGPKFIQHHHLEHPAGGHRHD